MAKRRAERSVPQPITDAQKTGERFLLWDRRDEYWRTGYWVNNPLLFPGEAGYWILMPSKPVQAIGITHYLPLPPKVKP